MNLHAINSEDDPSKWSKSKRKRMRLKRKKQEKVTTTAAAAAAAGTKLQKESDGESADSSSSKKRQKISSPESSTKQQSQPKAASSSEEMVNGNETLISKKKKKKKKRKQSTPMEVSPQQFKQSKPEPTKEQIIEPPSNNQTKPKPPMSTLQKTFLARLSSSRFRELNEELYTQPSSASFAQFTSNPELFEQYHIGFRRQVNDWPVNPVDVICKRIVVGWKKEKRGNEKVVVADFGCGDAKLGERLLRLRVDEKGVLCVNQSEKKKGSIKSCPFQVNSFDLVSGGNPLVTPADISNVPLPDESVDVGVYCLALMGTNIADFVREGWRVLKFGGVLHVAEVRSRFETCAEGDAEGNTIKNGKLKHKNGNRGENESEFEEPKPLMILDDFTALMERCGFRCTHVDRLNKMFLFMDFVKEEGSTGLSEKECFSAKPCIYKRR
jgi:ribosomal RNA-processing protein 8